MQGITRHFAAIRALVAEMIKLSPARMAAMLGLMAVLTFTEGVTLLMLAPLLELVGVVENPLPTAGGWIAKTLAAVGFEASLSSVLILFVAVAATRAVAKRVETRLIATVREDLVAAYRLRIYRAMSAAEWRYLVTRTPAEFGVALTSEIGRVGSAVMQITDLAVAIMVAAVYLALAVRLSAAMAVLVIGSAAILGLSIRGALRRAGDIGGRSAAARGRLHAAIAEHIAAIKTARVFGIQERHDAEFEALTRESHESGREMTAADTDLQQHLELGSTVLLALIVYLSSQVLAVSPALLLVLLFVFARLMPRFVNIYRLLQGLAMSLPIVAAVDRLERECAAARESDARVAQEVTLRHRIAFERVSFEYATRGGRTAVTDLDLTIDAGVTTAIVGASGSGKSTIADLLTGLLLPTRGRICIDRLPLTADALSAWRRQLGYVAQDTFLLNDTVRANLLWAHPSATEAEIAESLSLAAADAFVADLPRGLDTLIGERGVQLSGGERQRLAIARALLRRPRVLLLDEATSSLDVENERRIQDAIDRLQHRMTIVIITHRLATVRRADVIHVVDAGRLIETGSWEQLLARSDRFADLVQNA